MMRPQDPSLIIAGVCDYFRVPEKQVLGKSRSTMLVTPRWLAMRLLRDQELSLPSIGYFVNRHHTTVMHALRELPVSEEMIEAVRKHVIKYHDEHADD